MKRRHRFGLGMLALLGIAASGPALADDQYPAGRQPHAVDTGHSGSAPGAEAAQAVVVTQPSLVFSNGQWYTYADGNWYGLSGDDWRSMAAADDAAATPSHPLTQAPDAGAAPETTTWLILVPVATDEHSQADAATSNVPAQFESIRIGGMPVYQDEAGHWYVLAPMAGEDTIYVVQPR